MNLYKQILIAYHKIVFLVLYKYTSDLSSLVNSEDSININNNNLNLMLFTLETFNFTDFKTLLFNFNDLNIISVFDYFNTTPTHIYLFDSDGKLFVNYAFLIHNPYEDKDELTFNKFVAHLMNDILKYCVYEAMKKNVYTNNYPFYLHISKKKIIFNNNNA